MVHIDKAKRKSILEKKRAEINHWRQELSHASNSIDARNIQAYIDELEEDFRYFDKFYRPTLEEQREYDMKIARHDFPNDFIDD